MESGLAENLVFVVVALPSLAALALMATAIALGLVGLPILPEAIWRAVGLAASFATFALMLFGVTLGFDPEALGLQHLASYMWSESFGSRLLFGVDGIGLCFMLSTTGLVPLAILSARFEIRESVRAWVLVCLLFETTLLGALASANLLTFIFFWAASLIPVLVWMGRWGGGRSSPRSLAYLDDRIDRSGGAAVRRLRASRHDAETIRGPDPRSGRGRCRGFPRPAGHRD